jgi:CheY-like chemotaxis protein
MAKLKYQVLIVDDDEDIHAVTQLGLRGLKHQGKRCEFLSAYTGAEAVSMMRENPNISVILLDVVMESDHAGLDACRSIREELGNQFVRIILRTGQPGSSPEKKTIDNYDIDGYLAKSEITSTKLYSSVRTALKAWNELNELDRHRKTLALIHDCAMSVHSFDPLEVALDRILAAATKIASSELTILSLETFDESEVPSSYLMYLAEQTTEDEQEVVARFVKQANRLVGQQATAEPIHTEEGTIFPFMLHRELGHGWLFLQTEGLDELQHQSLSLLCGHAANALYSTVAQSVLTARQDDDDDFNVMAI